MHRLSQYAYLAELVVGQRVLELGCGDGRGAHFLANHGAAQVIAVDRSQRNIEDARSRWRVSNLELRCELPSRIELDDNSVDCVIIPDGGRFIRRGEVLEEVRRVLVPGGLLVVTAVSSERAIGRRTQPVAESGGRSRGVSYYELFERLEPLFAPVRMVAQQPFVATSLIGYGADDDAPGIDIDTTLVEDDEDEVTHYLAFCGTESDHRPGALTVVKLPTAEGLAALGAGFGLRSGASAEPGAPEPPEPIDDGESPSVLIAEALAAHAAHSAAQAAEIEENRAYIEELREDLEREAEASRAARDRLVDSEARVVALETELAGWRKRAAIAEGELLGVGLAAAGARATDAAPAPGSSGGGERAEPAPDREPERSLETELEKARRELARVTENWHQAEAKNDDVWRRVGELQSDLERHREDAVANASRQRHAAQVAMTRAVDEASKKLVSVQDQLSRAERRADELVAKLSGTESRNLELAQNLEEAELARTRLEDRLATAEGRREEVEQILQDLEARIEDSSPAVVDERAAAERSLEEFELELEGRSDRSSAGSGEAKDAEGESLGGPTLAAVRHLMSGIAGELADCRALLADLGSGLGELAEAPRDATGRPDDSRLRDLAGELGVKDAELTLLNLGVSSLQKRVQQIVDRVRATRREMAGQAATEMLAIMDRLTESLAGY